MSTDQLKSVTEEVIAHFQDQINAEVSKRMAEIAKMELEQEKELELPNLEEKIDTYQQEIEPEPDTDETLLFTKKDLVKLDTNSLIDYMEWMFEALYSRKDIAAFHATIVDSDGNTEVYSRDPEIAGEAGISIALESQDMEDPTWRFVSTAVHCTQNRKKEAVDA